MKYLDSIDLEFSEDITDEYDDEEEVVVEYVKPKKKKVRHKKTKSTEIVEYSDTLISNRIAESLNNIGLNETAINNVLSYVFEGVDMSTMNDSSSMTESTKPKSKSNKSKSPNNDIATPKNVVSYAETLLSSPMFVESSNNNNDNNLPYDPSMDGYTNNKNDFNDVADKATSLLY